MTDRNVAEAARAGLAVRAAAPVSALGRAVLDTVGGAGRLALFAR